MRGADSAAPSTRSERLFRAAVLLAALTGLAAGDSLKPPYDQVTAKAGVAAIDAYRATVGALLHRTGIVRCRFEPTCSYYGEAVIKRYGIVRGGWMAAQRVFRCGPWTPAGTKDPAPVSAL